MPRIRILKNYDNFTDGEERDREGVETENGADSGSSYSPQKGWWSNASIIQGLPEPKIREALAHYRLLINQLEEELLVRRIPHNREPDLSIGSMRQVSSHSKYAPARERKRSSHFAKFLKRQTKGFSSEARLKLEETWSLILKEFYNGNT